MGGLSTFNTLKSSANASQPRSIDQILQNLRQKTEQSMKNLDSNAEIQSRQFFNERGINLQDIEYQWKNTVSAYDQFVKKQKEEGHKQHGMVASKTSTLLTTHFEKEIGGMLNTQDYKGRLLSSDS